MKKILALVGDFYQPADYLPEALQNTLGDKYSLSIKDNHQDQQAFYSHLSLSI